MEKLISEFSFGLFFWQLLIFVGLIYLLKKVAWKPILDAVNDRETSIKDSLSAAQKAREEMASIQEDNQRILKEARAERDALLKAARQTSNQMVEQAKTEAKARHKSSSTKHRKLSKKKNATPLSNSKNKWPKFPLKLPRKCCIKN